MRSPSPFDRRVLPLLALSVLLLAGIPLPASGRAARDKATPSSPGTHFLIRLRPARPGAEATEEDRTRIIRHFEYLKELQAEGKVLLAGMAADIHEEIVVIQAPDRLEAERMMVSDPAVSGDVYLAELHPFTLVASASSK